MKSVLTLFAISAFFGGHALAAESRPNVLFIALDDLNDWIGCLGGHPQTRTPNLDRLAASGVLFRNAYTAAASCNPSRTAIFSGLPPHRSGLYTNTQKMREVMPEAELLPRYFSKQGYWSAGSGKMLHYIIDPPTWDDYFPAKAKDNPFPHTFYPEKRPVNLPRAGDWQYVETDWAELDVTDEQFGGDWAVTKWIGEQLSGQKVASTLAEKDGEKMRLKSQPLFLACGIYRPHEPWFVPKKYFEPFPLESIQLPPGYKADDVDDLPPVGQRLARNRYFAHIQKHEQWKKGIQAYLASIHFADAMLGRVLDALEKSPQRDNTIVVLWSDHGWHLGEKEHWQKFTGWRVCARVPLMIRVPKGAPGLLEGTTPGSVCDRPVSLVDLFGTLTDLCGLPPKADIESRSLAPLLHNPQAEWPHVALTHLDKPENYAISTQRWRYIHYAGDEEELYDLETDPHEWTNLATKPDHAAKLAEMRLLKPKQVASIHGAQPGVNWPQWRGQAAAGVDTRVELPASWDLETGENIRWRTPVAGLAHASPIVWGDRIYIATAIKPGEVELKVGLYGAGNSADDNAPHQWRLLALDRATGKVAWDTLAHEGLPRHARHTKASQCNSTPVTDGKHIVAIFGSEGLFCFDMEGKLLWRKDLGKMDAGKLYSPPALQWGFASSPVMHEGLILVQCDVVSEQFIAAYRVEDGAEVWRTPRTEVGTWCTPAIDLADGRRQVIVNGYKHIGGYDLDTGKQRWRLREGGDNPIPTPIFGHGLVYLTSAHGATRPMRAVRPDALGDITPPDIDQTNEHIAWVHSRRGSYLQTPIVVGDLLFACHDTGVVTCFDARTGEVHYSERLAASGQGFSASPVSDGRHVYFASERGEVFPLPVGTKFIKPEPRSVGEICMATPAITDGMLIFRTRSHVLAVGAKKPAAKDSAAVKPASSPRDFSRYLALETARETSANISIGDVNGDKHPDIVLAKGRHWPLHNRILLNDGKGAFSVGTNLSDTPDRSYTAALADIDGDGSLDIVVSNDKPDSNRVYLNKGGQWIASGEFGDPSWSTRNLLLADLNRDSKPDLIIANRKMPSYVCLNDGSGNFASALKLDVESASTIAAADFDGDGAIDLASPHRDGGQSFVLWNDGGARFEGRTPFGSDKGATRAIATGDMNGDGLPDIVAGDEKQGVSLYLNQGGRQFGKGSPLTAPSADAYAIALADLDQNGALDIVIGYSRHRGHILWNDGSGTNLKASEWNDGEGAVYGIAIADLDGDGWPDIAAARSDAPNGVWFSARQGTKP